MNRKYEEKIRQEILDFEELSSKQSSKEIIQEFYKLNNTMPDDNIREMRMRIHYYLTDIIDVIHVHNGMTIYPWEVESKDLGKFGKDLMSKGYTSQGDLEDLFNTEHGKRLFNESQRYFTVVFKSGTKRSVHPYANFSFMPRDKKMVQFLSKLKKKRPNSQQN